MGLSSSSKDIKDTSTNGVLRGDMCSSTTDQSNSSDDNRNLGSSTGSSSKTTQSCNCNNTSINLDSNTASEHLQMSSSPAVLPLRQLAAILVISLTHSSCNGLLVESGLCQAEDLSSQERSFFLERIFSRKILLIFLENILFKNPLKILEDF